MRATSASTSRPSVTRDSPVISSAGPARAADRRATGWISTPDSAVPSAASAAKITAEPGSWLSTRPGT